MLRSLVPAASLLAAAVPATSLRALSTQAQALTSLASFGNWFQQPALPSSLDLPFQQQRQQAPVLLGQHALLPETARALAELQAAAVAAPATVPEPLDLGLDLGLTLDDPTSPFGGADPWLCHTKRTFNPSLIIRKRRHGFLSRLGNRGGRKVMARRRAKGRWRISA